jgi:hypothetical protein
MEVSDVPRFEPLLKQRGFIQQIPFSPHEADAAIV